MPSPLRARINEKEIAHENTVLSFTPFALFGTLFFVIAVGWSVSEVVDPKPITPEDAGWLTSMWLLAVILETIAAMIALHANGLYQEIKKLRAQEADHD